MQFLSVCHFQPFATENFLLCEFLSRRESAPELRLAKRKCLNREKCEDFFFSLVCKINCSTLMRQLLKIFLVFFYATRNCISKLISLSRLMKSNAMKKGWPSVSRLYYLQLNPNAIKIKAQRLCFPFTDDKAARTGELEFLNSWLRATATFRDATVQSCPFRLSERHHQGNDMRNVLKLRICWNNDEWIKL
jgi:hypothetical protein